MRRKELGKRVLAGVFASTLAVTSAPATMTVNAADHNDSNVMIDKGGYKTEVYGVGTYDWVGGYDRESKLPPSQVYLTDNYKETVGTVPTSDWASSVVFDKYSESLYAHPLAYRAASNGMQMANPAVVNKTSTIDGEPLVESLLKDSTVELVVGGKNFTAKDAKVDKTTDWTYDIFMENEAGTSSMMTTMSKGSPYAYYEFDNMIPQISLGAGATDMAIYKNSVSSNQIGISVKNKTDNKIHYYGIYAPEGTTWTNAGGALTAKLPSGKNYISVAALPDNSDATFAAYAKYAYNFITDTVVEWNYNEETSKVTTTYNFETTNMETGVKGGDTIMALYPHQYRYLSDGSLASYKYDTIRGTMKTVIGNSYETEMTYTGVLPVMPTPEEGKGDLVDQISYYWDYYKNTAKSWSAAAEWQYGGYDTYWMGKNFNRLADVLLMSSVLDDDDETIQGWTDDMTDGLQSQLEYWFDPYQVYESGNQVDNYFYYHKDYGTMIGYASGYGSDFEVNDHHFHYGYWIKAAAVVAMMDETDTWEDSYGGMVYELIDDIANPNRDGRSHNNIAGKSDTKYPFLRNFDIYEGHSWASGVANYEYDANGNLLDPNGGLSGGNNQESSTEAVNAWAALVMWGEAVGDEEIRDLGVYLYTTEVAAIEDYYYDVHDEVFTDAYEDEGNYNIETVTRLFAGRYDHTAWWTEDPIEVTTISMLPMTGATLFLGKYPEKVKAVYDSIAPSSKQWTEYVANVQQICTNYGKSGMLTDPYTHQDILAEYYALYDPQAAMDMWSIDDINGKQYIEFGDSRAHTYGYIQSMIEYGTPNMDITGSTPFSMVFEKDGVKTYVAYNASNEDETVYFTDGTYINVEAGKFYVGDKHGKGENPNVGEKVEYTIEYYTEDLDGEGFTKKTETKKAEAGDVITLTAEEIEGFTFDTNNKNNVLEGTVSAEKALVLKVYYTRNEYKLTYELNGGKVSVANPDSYKYGEMFALNSAAKDGFVFAGWYASEDFATSAITKITETTTGDMKLYAKFVVTEEETETETETESEPETNPEDKDNNRADFGCELKDGKLVLYVTDSADKASVVAYYKVFDTQAQAKAATLAQLPGYGMTKTDGVFEYVTTETLDATKYVAYAFNQAGRDVPMVVALADLTETKETQTETETETEKETETETQPDDDKDTNRTAAGVELENGNLVLYVADSADKASVVAYYRVYDTKEQAENARLADLPGYGMTKDSSTGVFEYVVEDVDTTKYLAYAFNQAGRDVPTVIAISSLNSSNDNGNKTRTDAGCELNNGELVLYVTDSADKASVVAYYRVYDTEAQAKAATLSALPGYNMTKTEGIFEYNAGKVDTTKYLAYAFNQAGRDVPMVIALSDL